MSIENSIYLRNTIIELLRNELPVLRAKARVSQGELAEKIGISRQTYSSIETGKREMSWTTFLALIAYFQNNENTRNMISKINGLSEGIEIIMESPDEVDEK
nr:helix-turn-helix domain-containing protein [uncultured Acetatifactor sp.]